METGIAVFRGKEIRKTIQNNEWWFSIGDVVGALTDTTNSTDYIKKMRKREAELAKGWGQIVTPLWLETEGGRQRVNCANTEGIFRIIQSIPSPKAEPFKRWLAKVGYERVQEIDDPELGTQRTRAIYKAKGYSEDVFPTCVRMNRKMQNKSLPETYKGYLTDELLNMYGKISNHGSLKGEPRDKIRAMRNLLREYRLAPIHQAAAKKKPVEKP